MVPHASAARGKPGNAADGRPESAQTAPLSASRPATKQALVIELLSRPAGATLDDLVSATGWLPHTTRAALTGLRKKGYTLEKSKREDGTTTYCLSDAPAAKGAAREAA